MSNIDEKIKKRLEKIKKIYDFENILAEDKNNEAVAKYYVRSDFAYKWVHGKGDDTIHMGLSEDGVFHKGDFQKQAKIVAESFSKNTKNVLELGAGRLFNTRLLANQFPNINFTALDLPNRNFLKNKVPSNVSLIEGDYSDLSNLPESSFDVVFAVETICHSDNKERVIEQARRVLKKGGLLIIFDLYYDAPRQEMSEFHKYVADLVFASMKISPGDNCALDTKKYCQKQGFKVEVFEDASNKILPTLNRLERFAKFYFAHPTFGKILRRFVSEDCTVNSIAGYLMPITFKDSFIHQYNILVAKKK